MALSKIEAESLASGAITSAALPAGSVLQVVQATNTTDTTVTSAVEFITASITPSSTSNKILVMGVFSSVARRNNTNSEGLWSLHRNSSVLHYVDGVAPWNGGATNQRTVGSISFNYLDSPSTTSSTTYKMVVSCGADGVDINDEGGLSSLILLEIAG